MLIALVLTQLIGFPCTLGFGLLARRLSAKQAILLGLAAYMIISIAGFFMIMFGTSTCWRLAWASFKAGRKR